MDGPGSTLVCERCGSIFPSADLRGADFLCVECRRLWGAQESAPPRRRRRPQKGQAPAHLTQKKPRRRDQGKTNGARPKPKGRKPLEKRLPKVGGLFSVAPSRRTSRAVRPNFNLWELERKGKIGD